jgi:hypothetical protein
MERDVVEIEVLISVAGMIGDDAGNLHRQLADTPAIEHVGQAVVEFRHQQHHPASFIAVTYLPLQLKPAGDNGKARLQAGQRHVGQLRLENETHEESPGFGVAELLGFQDVVASRGEMAGYRSDDAGAIRT